MLLIDPSARVFVQVNLKNEPHERSNASIRSADIQAGKTARYNVSSFAPSLSRDPRRMRAGRSRGSEETAYWPIVASNENDARVETIEGSALRECQYVHRHFHRPDSASLGIRLWPTRQSRSELNLGSLRVLLGLLSSPLRTFSRRKKSNSIGISNGRC